MIFFMLAFIFSPNITSWLDHTIDSTDQERIESWKVLRWIETIFVENSDDSSCGEESMNVEDGDNRDVEEIDQGLLGSNRKEENDKIGPDFSLKEKEESRVQSIEPDASNIENKVIVKDLITEELPPPILDEDIYEWNPPADWEEINDEENYYGSVKKV